jgi:hypothetical protein
MPAAPASEAVAMGRQWPDRASLLPDGRPLSSSSQPAAFLTGARMSHMLTVVLCNFNHARFLPDSLAALISQTRQADELIVIDDASTDNSVAVVESLLPRLPNARVLRNGRNLGVVANMNRGLAIARGQVVYFAAADDVTYPTLFAKGMALLDAYPRAGLFSARSELLDAAGHVAGLLPTPLPLREPGFVDPSAAARQLMRDDGWFMGNTTLYRRGALTEIGGFPEELQAFTDGYVSRLLALKHGACFSPEALGAWRRMEGGMAWSQTTSTEKTMQLIGLVERKMAEAGKIFPAGYLQRWKRRHLFGAWRFALVDARRRAGSRSTIWRLWALSVEIICTAWWFVTLRPWDVVAVGRRRWQSMRVGRIGAIGGLPDKCG